MERFKSLLRPEIMSPSEDALFHLLLTHAETIAIIDDKRSAIRLYNWANNLLKASTKRRFYEATSISIDELVSMSTSVYYACSSTCEPLVVKVISNSSSPEVAIALELRDGPWLAPSTHHTVDRRGGEKWSGLVMPKYSHSLQSMAVALPPDTVLARSRSMIEAVNYIHSKGYVHMDIKGHNIFVDYRGQWWLGDFGACVPVGTDINETTFGMHPELTSWGRVSGVKAAFKYDWFMLSSCLIQQLLLSDERKLLMDEDDVILPDELEAALQRSTPHGHDLQQLLLRMLAFDGETFN